MAKYQPGQLALRLNITLGDHGDSFVWVPLLVCIGLLMITIGDDGYVRLGWR